MKGTHLFDPVDGDATEVTITPYIKFPKQGEFAEVLDGITVDVDMALYEGEEREFDSFTVKLP